MGAKIIIVDDDRETREMLQVLLQLEGFEVKLAANGLRLISTLHVDKPDAILLDVMMSWIDGFELCQAIKRNPEFAAIPVIFISGRTAPTDRDRGISVGASDYFTKPLDTHRLVARLRQVVSTPQRGDTNAIPS
jgi:DNA-binding response OmpR family regulator